MTFLKRVGIAFGMGLLIAGAVFWLLLFPPFSTRYSAEAPDGLSELQVRQKCGLPDCYVSIKIARGWTSEEISAKSDCAVKFAHAAWLGPVVVAYVDGGWCGPIRVAYDLNAGKAVEFEDFKGRLSQEIVRSYQVTNEELKEYEGDVLKWATYPGDGRSHRAMREFESRFPKPLF